jgi:hypothetical protein
MYLKVSKEYLASELARLDTMLYRHVGHTRINKYAKEPDGYTLKLFKTYLTLDYDVLEILYDTKKVVLTIEKM